MAEMKSNLSALMAAFDGKTQNGQILVTRPQLLHKDFTKGKIDFIHCALGIFFISLVHDGYPSTLLWTVLPSTDHL